MTHSKIVIRLIELLEGLVPSVDNFDKETALVSDAGLESIQVIEYLCEVEDEFDIVIDEEALSYVNTVGDLAETVLKISGGKS
jgi:acyl carrier protein